MKLSINLRLHWITWCYFLFNGHFIRSSLQQVRPVQMQKSCMHINVRVRWTAASAPYRNNKRERKSYGPTDEASVCDEGCVDVNGELAAPFWSQDSKHSWLCCAVELCKTSNWWTWSTSKDDIWRGCPAAGGTGIRIQCTEHCWMYIGCNVFVHRFNGFIIDEKAVMGKAVQ